MTSKTPPRGPEVPDRYKEPDRVDAPTGSPLVERVRDWCRGRVWWYRAPVLLLFAYILLRHLQDPMYSSIFDGINLVIHEAGHFAFSYFGEFLEIAGGTIFQLMAPIVAGFAFYRQKDYFAITVTLFWLGTNFIDVGIYAGDARAQLLPLVSPTSGDPLHDWHYLLAITGNLHNDTLIASLLRKVGLLSMAGAMGLGGWMMKVMAEGRPTPPSS
jgi:hypothetical protein